jgi:hypothetical protein
VSPMLWTNVPRSGLTIAGDPAAFPESIG